MALLALDIEKQNDPFYRYKMPRVMIKVEGNGNGIKTVVCNINEIGERVARNVEYIMRFLGHELAVTTKFKDEKWILTGASTQEKVQASIFDFIKKFVLCKACRNPETVIQVDEKKNINLQCKACSRVTPVDPLEKLCNLLIRNEKVCASEEAGVGKTKKKKKDAAAKPAKSKDEIAEEAYNKATREAQANDTITVGQIPIEELPNPVEMLRAFVNQQPPPSETEIHGKVFDAKNDYGLDDKAVVFLVFEALFDENVLTQIPTNAKLVRKFLKDETEKEVIVSLMLLCNEKVGLKSKFAKILVAFYEAHVISEAAIVAWHTGKNSKRLDKASQLFYKEKAQPVIEWLQKEESDDDDDEDGTSE
jgi:translation initiation factor 5